MLIEVDTEFHLNKNFPRIFSPKKKSWTSLGNTKNNGVSKYSVEAYSVTADYA